MKRDLLMKIEMISVKDIVCFDGNPRKHDDKQINLLAESIKEYGFLVPMIVDKEGTIVCGHARFFASQKLDLKEIPCIRVENLSSDQVRKFRIAENKLSDLSFWDNDFLRAELDDLDNIGAELTLTAFSKEELGGILGNQELVNGVNSEGGPTTTILKYKIIIEFDNPQEQEKALKKLTREGYDCRLKTTQTE